MNAHKTLTRTLAALTLLGAAAAVPAQAATVSITPATPEANLGGSVLVTVDIADLGIGGAPKVGVFDFDFSYDAGVLSFSDVSFGAGLDVLSLGSIQLWDDVTPGLLNVFELSFDMPEDLYTLQPDAFTLFTLSFDAIGAGVSNLGLTINALGDEFGEALAADVFGSSVTVAPVPLPAAGWLLLSGIAALAGFGRRRAAVQAQSRSL